uniref:Ig-like domain-containing protein n=1 Tax=Branchiostoma floridae TaxID=7739 RepID=C3YSK9_BRAFL|eukprot:XP_002600698.1 hypothetical protein BRAFLDRAFT_67763 [Branchiostoma floridae]
MAEWTAKFYLMLVVVRLIVPCVEAGDWQHCQNVSPLRCSVGDSRNGGSKYRYDIADYESKWNPYAADSYRGPFRYNNLNLYAAFTSCYDCAGNGSVSGSSVIAEVQSVTLSPSQQDITIHVIADNNVGTMTKADTIAISRLPCGRDCSLWLVNCNITTIEVGAFAKLPQVTALVIWQSNLQTLRSGTFEGMEGLETLLLLGNNITCLEAGAFEGLSQLLSLYLVDNQILTMAPGMLRGLQLDWLDVSANSIWYIAPGVLQGTRSVRNVYIVKNKLQSVNVGMFAELAIMENLYLEYNEISWIADDAFHSNKRLGLLSLQGNKLTYLSGFWSKPSNLGKVVLKLKGNAIIAAEYPGRGSLRWQVRLPNNPLRCTCASIGLYESLWRQWTEISRAPWHSLISLPTGCPASSLMEWPPVQVNVSALPCPTPFVEIVNVEQNHETREYEVVGNVYWEDLPQVSWVFANGSEHSMNIMYNTNSTTHASLGMGNLTVQVKTYLRAEGWTKCKMMDFDIREPQKWKVCSNYMGKSSFTLWLEGAGPLALRNTLFTASSASGSYTTNLEVTHDTHMSHSHTTQHPTTTAPPLMSTLQHRTTTRQTTAEIMSTGMTVDRDSNVTWYISVSATAVTVLLFAFVGKVVLKCFRCPPDMADGVRATVAACSNSPLGDHDSPNDSVISPYAEGRFEDHESLDGSEISPYAVGHIEDHGGLNGSESGISPYAEGRLEDHDSLDGSEISPYAEGRIEDHGSLRDINSSGSSEIVPYGQGALNAAYEERSNENTNAGNSNVSDQNCYQHPSTPPNPGATHSSAYQQRTSYENTGTETSKVSDQNCYQHPSILPNPGATQSSAYQQCSSYEDTGTETSKVSDQNCYQHPSILANSSASHSSAYQLRRGYFD